jgi:hypothetical protein
MTRVLAPQVRNSLAAIYQRLPASGLTTDKIISLLRKDHAKELLADTADILHIGLVKLVDQIGARRTRSTANLQLELFQEYAPPLRLNLIVKTAKGKKNVWKNLGDVTIGEAEQYVAEHEKPPVRLSPQTNELSRLLADIKGHSQSSDDMLIEVYAAAKAAGK